MDRRGCRRRNCPKRLPQFQRNFGQRVVNSLLSFRFRVFASLPVPGRHSHSCPESATVTGDQNLGDAMLIAWRTAHSLHLASTLCRSDDRVSDNHLVKRSMQSGRWGILIGFLLLATAQEDEFERPPVTGSMAATPNAVRTLVRTWAGEPVEICQVKGGTSDASSFDPRLCFGLEQSTEIDRIEIRWPSGARESLKAKNADGQPTIIEPLAAM
jgi:hypothetical protein